MLHPQLLLTTLSPSSGIEECGDGKREDSSERINLELGIGSYACVNEVSLKKKKKINQEKKVPFFTDAQFHEFYAQILVYKFISSVLPFQSPLPNLMTAFNSFCPSIFKKYLSFTGFGSLHSDSNTMDDPKPGRCRRTDGRKWRCTKNVIPNQKYCERHMHRGHQGSRKHEEPIQTVSKPDNKIPTSDFNTKMPMVSLVTTDSDNGIFISLDPSQQINNGSRNCGSCTKDMGTGFENGRNGNIRGKKRRMDKNNRVGFVATQFGLCPKRVLNCGTGKIDIGLGSKNDVLETEPQRCQRTDGKKWQCKRNSIPKQKYCEMHMHRGTKRLLPNPESLSNAPFTLTSDPTAHISRTMARNLDNRINLNTTPESPQHISGYNCSSSNSDATTNTDENISIFLT